MNNTNNKKIKKDKIAKDFKLYNVIMGNFWKFIATVLIGVCLGYLTTRNSKTEDNYMVFCIILFFVIGVINFFVGIMKEMKRLEKHEEKSKKQQNQNTNNSDNNEEN